MSNLYQVQISYPPRQLDFRAADTSAALNMTYHLWGSPAVLHTWSSSNPCTAAYVTCGSRGQITSIIFPAFKGLPGQQRILTSISRNIFPYAFSTYTSLQTLQLDNLPLTGTLPTSYSRLTNLQSLTGAANRITGSLPPQWSTMAALTSLSFDYNMFLSGPLPVQWSLLTNLQSIEFIDQPLTGTFPPQWSTLAGMKNINILGCNLEGLMPFQFTALTSLTSISGFNTRRFCGQSIPLFSQLDANAYFSPCSQTAPPPTPSSPFPSPPQLPSSPNHPPTPLSPPLHGTRWLIGIVFCDALCRCLPNGCANPTHLNRDWNPTLSRTCMLLSNHLLVSNILLVCSIFSTPIGYCLDTLIVGDVL